MVLRKMKENGIGYDQVVHSVNRIGYYIEGASPKSSTGQFLNKGQTGVGAFDIVAL